MYKQVCALAMSFFSAAQVMAEPVKGAATDNGCPAALNFSVRALGEDKPVNLCETYKGKVVIIVNTASKCGFTPQFEGLEKLYSTYKDRGLVVLGFPCNQFGGQEPGDEQQIATFCQTRFAVTFPMFAKVEVNGAQAHPLFQFLTQAKPGILNTESIKWNFTKFLINRQGEVVGRYAPTTKPSDLLAEIEALLG